jgi:hypothetical protein
VIDPTHCDGLPDGHTRATVVEAPPGPASKPPTLPTESKSITEPSW